MKRQTGVSLVEVAMVFVVISIVAVVAVPTIGMGDKSGNSRTVQAVAQVANNIDSIQKVKSAYAIAIAEQGDYPLLSNVVDFIDADFASQMGDLSGIIFRDGKRRLLVNTFRDAGCKVLTSNESPGVSDVVRCI